MIEVEIHGERPNRVLTRLDEDGNVLLKMQENIHVGEFNAVFNGQEFNCVPYASSARYARYVAMRDSEE